MPTGPGDVAVNRGGAGGNPCSLGTYMLSGKERYKLTKYIAC